MYLYAYSEEKYTNIDTVCVPMSVTLRAVGLND